VRIVAVVLNWRRPDDTIACVRSLAETAPDTQVIVVDNASGDGSVDRLRVELTDVTLLESDANLGYAGGNNLGIHAALDAGAGAVLILNNDVMVQPGCVQLLADTAARRDTPAILTPLSLSAEQPGTIDHFRTRVDLRNVALLAEGRGEPRDAVYATEPMIADYATGSALLAPAGLLERLGGFDERFFLVWEDVDLSLRARAQGGEVVLVPTAEVLHRGGVSFGEQRAASPLYQYFFVRNSFLIVRKHVRWPFKTATLRRIERRYRGWVEAAEPAVARAIGRGIDDGLAGRYGPAPEGLVP